MYQTVKIGITESQLASLMAGQKIFVEKSQFTGDVPIPMTKAQATLIATASRGVNLKLSGPARKQLSGEGFIGDAANSALRAAKSAASATARAIIPIARRGADAAVDFLAGKIPTGKLGNYKGVGDAAVGMGKRLTGKLLDKLQKMLGGAAGKQAIDAQMGAGWFDEYLLPGLSTAAKIAMPLMGRGLSNDQFNKAIDDAVQLGDGWFQDYLLPGVETAAKIATPFIRGHGIAGLEEMDGQGWFTDYLLPGLETAAKIATPFIRGRGAWVPMNEKKVSSGKGLVL